jgi:hypothetical protein
MKRWLTLAMLTVAVSLTLSNVAYAQLKDDLELNLFGGGSMHTKNRYEIGFPQSITPISGEFKLDKAIRYGVRVNVYTRGHWGEEFFYSFEPNTAHFIRRRTPPTSLDLNIQVHNAGVNAMYYLQEDETRRTRAFLSVGLGATIYSPTQEARAIARDPLRGNLQDMDSSREIALNYGGGFKSRVSNYVAFRLDLRGFTGRNPSFGFARESNDPNATVFPNTGAIFSGEASAGLIFYFKKR